MKFRPGARLDTSQITDVRHNVGFRYYLAAQRQYVSPFARMRMQPANQRMQAQYQQDFNRRRRSAG